MRKIILLISLFAFCTFTYSQKKIKYADENFKFLTKEEFLSNPLNKYHFLYKIENDSSIVNIKVERQKYGRINKEILQKIKNQLFGITKTKIDSSKIIIVNYYPGLDKCNKGPGNNYLTMLYNTYKREISKRKDISQFFIYKNIKGTKKYSRKIKWLKDPNQIIEHTFFRFHYPCGSYVIIKPNGNYFTERGEYRITDILNKI